MTYTTQDLVEAVLAYGELTHPDRLQFGPAPSVQELDTTRHRMLGIAQAIKADSEEITREIRL